MGTSQSQNSPTNSAEEAEIKKARLHQKIATTIFFESNGGQLRTEATIGEIKAAVGSPDVNLADVDQVLETLTSSCYYLSVDRNRYRFSLTPNINKLLTDRRSAVQQKEIDERLRKEIETCFRAGPRDLELDRRCFPTKSNDIPDRPQLTLVVLGPDTPSSDPGTLRLIETIVRDAGSSGRTFKSALLFATPDSAGGMAGSMRDVLAWEAIDEDDETKSRLDETQRRMLALSLARAKSDLTAALWRSYRHVYLLGKDNAVRPINLGSLNPSMAGSLVEVIVNQLVRTDEISAGVGPSQLIKYWPAASAEWSTKAVRDAFFASPLLPRLLRVDSIRRTIADGVSQGSLGYARKDPSGRVILERFEKSLSEAEVEISDDAILLRADDARKLLEPPRLTRLTIRPEHATVRLGEQVAFTLAGTDQYGQSFSPPTADWIASGGSITADGLFTAGDTVGLHAIRAKATGLEAAAEVRLRTEKASEDDSGRDEDGGRPKSIRWSGAVPPQKWMNFYQKVLSRFAAVPGLQLEVRFEVPADDEQGRTKADEARAGLRELGLDDKVDLS